VTNEEFETNKKMMEIGREHGALEAKKALESVDLSMQLGQIAGRAQAFKSIKLIAEFLEWKHIAEIIDRKDFLNIQGLTNIDDYLESLGLGRSVAYTNLKIARTLSVEEIRLLGQVGFTRKDLLGYASLPDEARMEIREGKIINIEKAGREEIREIIEQVLQDSRQMKEETVKDIAAKDRVLSKKQEMINQQEQEIIQLESKIEGLEVSMGVPKEEMAYCKRVEELGMRLYANLAQVRALAEGEVPGPTAAMHMLALLNRTRMECNVWYQSFYDNHAPADAAPEEEWQQPE